MYFFWQAQNIGVESPGIATGTSAIDSMMMYGHDSDSEAEELRQVPTLIFVHIWVVFNRRGETRGVFCSIVRLKCRDMR